MIFYYFVLKKIMKGYEGQMWFYLYFITDREIQIIYGWEWKRRNEQIINHLSTNNQTY